MNDRGADDRRAATEERGLDQGAAIEAQARDIAFRPLALDDLTLMERWRAAPHVDAWWVGPRDRAGLHAKYAPRIDGREPVHVFVIELCGTPIGWIQWYRWSDHAEHAALIGAEPQGAGVDLAIGERGATGRGLGSLVLRAFLQREVFRDPGVTACISDVEVGNLRSVRAFLKAGFCVVRTLLLPDEPGRRHVMRCERP